MTETEKEVQAIAASYMTRFDGDLKREIAESLIRAAVWAGVQAGHRAMRAIYTEVAA